MKTTMPRDPYEVLGVQKGAAEDDIRKAYRKLAREFHPDRNPGNKEAEKRFKEIQEAYDLLSDKQKREQYDRFGFAGPDMGGAGAEGFPGGFHFRWGGPGGMGGAGGEEIPEELFEVFRNMGMGGMGGAGQSRQQRRRRPPPQEQTAEVEVPFTTAATGGSLDIGIDGREISVKIPAGAEDGQTLRLRGQAPGGGDLLLKLRIASHPYFERDGSDVILQVPISVSEALLGATVDVPTLDGTHLSVKVPSGASSGARLRLRGKGINGGDQYIEIKIVVPKIDDDRSRELIEELARLHPQHPRDNLPWS